MQCETKPSSSSGWNPLQEIVYSAVNLDECAAQP